jgi:hypothetical protein
MFEEVHAYNKLFYVWSSSMINYAHVTTIHCYFIENRKA